MLRSAERLVGQRLAEKDYIRFQEAAACRTGGRRNAGQHGCPERIGRDAVVTFQTTRGAATILVNLTPTPLDEQMDVVIRDDVVKTLQQFRRALVG